MEDKLRAYAESLFAGIPYSERSAAILEQTASRLIVRYRELLNEGKSEEEAYASAIVSLGDVGALLNAARQPVAASADDEEALRASNKRSALLLAVAVALYILCPVPCILTENKIGVVLLFVMVAVATGLIIFGAMTKKKAPATVGTAPVPVKENSLFKAFSSALWAVIVALYFLISFATGAWYVTWVMFLIGAALEGVLKAVFDLKGDRS